MSRIEFSLVGIWILILVMSSAAYWSGATSPVVSVTKDLAEVLGVRADPGGESRSSVAEARSSSETPGAPLVETDWDATAENPSLGSRRGSADRTERRAHGGNASAQGVLRRASSPRVQGAGNRQASYNFRARSQDRVLPDTAKIHAPGSTSFGFPEQSDFAQDPAAEGGVVNDLSTSLRGAAGSPFADQPDSPADDSSEAKSHRPSSPNAYAYNEDYYCRTAREVREVCANGGTSSERYDFCLAFGGYYTNGRHCGYLP